MDLPDQLAPRVLEIVRGVPPGKVMSYGQIAHLLGLEDARAVGWIMHALGGTPEFPWWRVLNNEGKITIKDPVQRARQRDLLIAEGVAVADTFTLDIEKYRHGSNCGAEKTSIAKRLARLIRRQSADDWRAEDRV